MLISAGLFNNLVSAAAAFTASALQNGRRPTFLPPTDEPSAVAAMTWVGIPDMVASWRPLVSPLGLKLSVHSVFVHGSPKVNFTDSSGSRARCELADLLLVVDDMVGRTVQDRRAVLVQAKLFAAGGGFSISGTAKDQLDLLENWHSFKFVSSRLFGTAPRDFGLAGQPGHVGECGRYGGIGGVSSAPSPYEWEHIAPSSTPPMLRKTGSDLVSFLAGMATGQAGTGREAYAAGSDDWSATIEDLLRVSAPTGVALKSTLGPGQQHPRGVTSLTLDIEELESIAGPDGGRTDPPLPSADRIERGGDEGISFVRIVVEA